MFKVRVYRDKDEKVYYVYGPNELTESKFLMYTYNGFAVDLKKYNVDMKIISAGNGLHVVLKHLDPVIIEEDKMANFIDNDNINKVTDFLPCVPITISEYNDLFNYAMITGQLMDEVLEKEEIDKDIEFAREYVKRK